MGYRFLPELMAFLGIEPYEALQIVHSAHRWPRPAASANGLRFLRVWARTKVGIPAEVTLRFEGGFDWAIIGARWLDETETAEFEAWEATR